MKPAQTIFEPVTCMMMILSKWQCNLGIHDLCECTSLIEHFGIGFYQMIIAVISNPRLQNLLGCKKNHQ